MPNKLSHVRSAVTPILKAIGALLYPRFSEFRVIVLLVAMFCALFFLGLWPELVSTVYEIWYDAARDGEGLKMFLGLLIFGSGAIFWLFSCFVMIFSPKKISKDPKLSIAVGYFVIMLVLGALNLVGSYGGINRQGMFGVIEWVFTRVTPWYLFAQFFVLVFAVKGEITAILNFVATRMSDEQYPPYVIALGSALTILVMFWLYQYHYSYAALVFLTVVYVEFGMWCISLVNRLAHTNRK